MATDGPSGATAGPAPSDTVWRVPRPDAEFRHPDVEALAPLDVVNQLNELQRARPSLESNGLADALLDWLTPRLSHPETLMQGRIAPLLGAAADRLTRNATAMPDMINIGATALEQELRQQQALAHRRSTLLASQTE